MNMIRKPERNRGPALARSAKATLPGIVGRARRPVAGTSLVPVGPGPSASAISPWLLSTRAGSRIASTVATTKSTKA